MSILRMLSMDTGTRIKQRMTLLGLKNVDIMRATGISSGGASQWVTGMTRPSGERLLALANTLQCSPDWILTGRGSIEDVAPAKMKVPILDSDQALRYLKERELPEEYKACNELMNGTSHVAFCLSEASSQFEPAYSQGAQYYIVPMPSAALSKLKGKLLACEVNGHILVGRLKAMAMNRFSLLLPDSSTVELEDASDQLIGLVTHIYNP